MEIEKWLPVVGYEGIYEVSSMGRIFRVDFNRFMKCSVGDRGYWIVRLSKNGKAKTTVVHKIIAQAFLGHKIGGIERVVDHIDNNRSNNSLANIQIITFRENLSKDRVNKSGFRGVNFDAQQNRFRASIVIGKLIHLGSFRSAELASKIRKKAEEKLHLFDGNPKTFRNLLKSL